MRKVIATEFVSLDGVMEDPSWTFRFSSEELEKFKFDELAASGALLLGRVTYEGFAAAWPSMMEQYEGPRRAELGEYADMMNGYPKYVVSTSLEEPLEWNNSTLVEGNVAEQVSRLKRQPGKDILVFGSGDLVNALMQHDLIDEYRLMIFPLSWGAGNGSSGTVSTRPFWNLSIRGRSVRGSSSLRTGRQEGKGKERSLWQPRTSTTLRLAKSRPGRTPRSGTWTGWSARGRCPGACKER